MILRFSGTANASVCAADGDAYELGGCEYNSCLPPAEDTAEDAAVEVCTNPWHGSMLMVVVFGFFLTFHGLCIGYAVYVPPYAFLSVFGGANVGVMSSVYAVNAAIFSMVYLSLYQVTISSMGWSGVWLLEAAVAGIGTLGMLGFGLMDCQGTIVCSILPD